MSSRALTTIITRLALITGLLVVCCAFGLPLIAALPPQLSIRPPLWSLLAPAAGGLAALAVLLLQHRAIRRTGRIGPAANLPTHYVLGFILTATTAIVVGAALEHDPLTEHRATLVFLCGPALAVALGLVLRALVHPPLMAELSRLAALDTAPRGPASGLGVLAIRYSLALVAGTLVVVALAMVGGHFHSLARANREQTEQRFLSDALQVAMAQTRGMRALQVEHLLHRYPTSSEGTVVGLDNGRITTHRPGLPRGSRLRLSDTADIWDHPTCQVAGQAFRCAIDPAGRVAVLLAVPEGMSHPALATLTSDANLLALGFFVFAAILGWAMGNDISRDFQVIASQLRAMAEQDRLDLGRPVTVTSIDEVGDLTAALGQLRIRLEQELAEHTKSLRTVREADRTKNEFFSDVSQELRTPLTTLCGYAQLLLDGSEGELSAAQMEDVRSIYSGGQQLLGLVNDVLDISVIESGHLHLSTEQVDLVRLCREMVQAQASVLQADKRSRVELQLVVDGDIPTIDADPRRLTQIVQNLLSNALKFTSEGSVTVRIQSLDDGARVAVSVQDTGVGIGQLDLPRVFETYRQVGELSARRQGSGLGLAIARHLAQRHGGTISVESAVGQGSTFTLVLPVTSPNPAGSVSS